MSSTLVTPASRAATVASAITRVPHLAMLRNVEAL